MRKVVHLIPYDGIGGVEIAARTMQRVSAPDTQFTVDYIYSAGCNARGPGKLGGLLPLLSAAARILRQKPDLLVVSLWRSSIVGIVVKLLRPRQRLVLLLHSVSDAHWVDHLVTSCTARLAAEIWGDSQQTLADRLPGVGKARRRVISFVARRLRALPPRQVQPSFIFWGRINRQKGLKQALELFSAIRARVPDAQFTIIGPDGGELASRRNQVRLAGLTDVVRFQGAQPLEQIMKNAGGASFYLQTSRWEGMGMSVVEAMQLGLVPVVTPVGEIRNYCKHGRNALLITSQPATLEDLTILLQDDARYQSMSEEAVATWRDEPLYAESMLRACAELLSKANERGGRERGRSSTSGNSRKAGGP